MVDPGPAAPLRQGHKQGITTAVDGSEDEPGERAGVTDHTGRLDMGADIGHPGGNAPTRKARSQQIRRFDPVLKREHEALGMKMARKLPRRFVEVVELDRDEDQIRRPIERITGRKNAQRRQLQVS